MARTETHPVAVPEGLWNELTIIAVDKIQKSLDKGKHLQIGPHAIAIEILRRSVARHKVIKEHACQDCGICEAKEPEVQSETKTD